MKVWKGQEETGDIRAGGSHPNTLRRVWAWLGLGGISYHLPSFPNSCLLLRTQKGHTGPPPLSTALPTPDITPASCSESKES